MKLNANITKVLSEAKSNFSDDEHEVNACVDNIYYTCVTGAKIVRRFGP